MEKIIAEPQDEETGPGLAASEWARSVADAWIEVLCGVNPLLEPASVREVIMAWSADLIAGLTGDPFDARVGAEVGERLETLESFQPGDLQRFQEALLPVLRSPLDARDHDRVTSLLFALGAGFFAAKAQHASQFGMDAQSRMSHDLKTPINAITGFSRVILKGIDGPITDFQREDLTSIYEAGQRLLMMINDVFFVRKRDAARTLIHTPPYQVAELLADVVRTAQPLAGEYEQTFDVQMAGDLGSLALDASMVRWVLLSLVSYAIRQANWGVITVRGAREGEALDVLLFSVSYQLPESLRAYTDTSSSAVAESPEWPSDIGLITCRHFCEELGGSVVISGREPVTFQVRLPAVPFPSLD